MDKDGYNDTQEAYERGFIDGMQKQMQSSVDKAVNGMTRQWVGLTDEEIWENDSYKVAITDQETRWLYRFARAIEAKLKERNT